MPSGYLDGNATGIYAGPLRGAQIDLYLGYMGPIRAVHLHTQIRHGFHIGSPYLYMIIIAVCTDTYSHLGSGNSYGVAK